MPPAANTSIRLLEDKDARAAFDLLRQLREHLDFDEFSRRLEKQRLFGFVLVGAFEDTDLVGVLGMRPVTTLARVIIFTWMTW